ncbi:unnamed protein product [Meloidogyne enterolobii]|uniref:Uncharacterized protein n=1 Tax=Meloidogyne enterolobii TaxID=390850 RepID=A0ACB0ZCH8_MELEN
MFSDKFSTPFYNHSFRLKLPTIIKSKEDIKIIYHYLNKLFNCSFEYASFQNFILNQELIQLLFGNAKIPKQLYIQKCDIIINDYDNEDLFQFILNHLACKILGFGLLLSKEMGKYKDYLFKILTKRGDNFKEINLLFINSRRNLDSDMIVTFYDQIVECIATSTDCSKIVPDITIEFSHSTSLKLSEKAEKVEIKQLNGVKYKNYQISNIHNSKVRFSFCNEERDIDFLVLDVKIKIMKE